MRVYQCTSDAILSISTQWNTPPVTWIFKVHTYMQPLCGPVDWVAMDPIFLLPLNLVMHQSIPAVPIPPPPGQPRGICSRCQSRVWGIRNFIAAPGAGH